MRILIKLLCTLMLFSCDDSSQNSTDVVTIWWRICGNGITRHCERVSMASSRIGCARCTSRIRNHLRTKCLSCMVYSKPSREFFDYVRWVCGSAKAL